MSEAADRSDVAIVGGGIVGLATAMALVERPGLSILVLEAEPEVARHQSGRNSGVIHSGLYYAPGSLKAKNCAEGREALYRFCAERGVPHERCGKVVIATREHERPALEALERRGRENGLEGLRRLTPDAIREREPHARGLAGLLVPQTGIVDFAAAARAMADRVREAGGTIVTGARVLGCRRDGGALVLESARGEHRCRALVNCAGLHADRIARLCGVDPGLRIVPFRGEYVELVAERRHLVRDLIYPVPDPRFPFLGVHFTRRPGGAIEAGPNAVLAFAREGYRRSTVSPRDLAEMLAWPGFWRMGLAHWRKGLAEGARALSRGAFVAALQRLVPELTAADLAPGRSGVRAQALARDGTLIDDFAIVEAERSIHVLNAPSPAATASISIGRAIAERVRARLG
jgi:L-2-hydroxyglutarate oxidase